MCNNVSLLPALHVRVLRALHCEWKQPQHVLALTTYLLGLYSTTGSSSCPFLTLGLNFNPAFLVAPNADIAPVACMLWLNWLFILPNEAAEASLACAILFFTPCIAIGRTGKTTNGDFLGRVSCLLC